MTQNILLQHATKAPAGFSHDGEAYASDDDGIVAIPSEIVSHALSHGFTVIAEKPAPKVLAKGAEGDKGKKPGKPEKEEGAEGDKAGAGK